MTTPFSQKMVERIAGRIRPNRRGFLGGSALVGAAVAAGPWKYITRPVGAYDAVCGPHNTCGEGYTVFCCTLTGQNSCPPGAWVGGWWKADNASFCGGAARYYIDCHEYRTSMTYSCRCNNDPNTCDHRRVACNEFRYGQCNTQIPLSNSGPVLCRVVSCTPPWQLYPGQCSTSSRTDNNTVAHSAPCLNRPTRPFTMFARGGDNGLWLVQADGTWTTAGGYLTGAPSVVSPSSGRFDVFVRGNDGAVWTNTWTGTAWTGWKSLDGYFTSDPVAVSRSNGTMDVLARGGEGALWMRSFNGSSWGPWRKFDAAMLGTPAAVAAGTSVRVVVRGVDNALHTATINNSTWSGWSPLGGYTTEDPEMVTTNGLTWVFIRGNDGGLWQLQYNGSWGPWVNRGGRMIGPPAAVVANPGTVDVFVRGTDNAVWTLPWGGDWASLGGSVSASPDPTSPAAGVIDLFARNTDGSVGQISRTSAGAWGVWVSRGGYVQPGESMTAV